MTAVEIIVRLVAGVLLTAANAFFVLTEFALTRIAELGEEEIVALSTEDGAEESFRRLAERQHVRFPLVRGSLDDFVGIVYLPVVLRHLEALRGGETAFEEVAAEPLTLPPDLPVSRAIDRFQEARQELALITEDGHVLGLFTATDALEAIAGELEDPLDAVTEG